MEMFLKYILPSTFWERELGYFLEFGKNSPIGGNTRSRSTIQESFGGTENSRRKKLAGKS
jgi:hypothetical protein